jgi:hypothetical protein
MMWYLIRERCKKCRHHDHATGIFKEAYCNLGNLKMRLDHLKIPVLFQNGKGCDFYPIVKQLNEAQYSRVRIIPDNTEKYKMMEINSCKGIDSLSYLQNSI